MSCLFVRAKAGEHLREHLLRLVGVAGFGKGTGGKEVIVDKLRVVGMVFGELPRQYQHRLVLPLARGV